MATTDHAYVPCDRPDLCSMVGRCHHAHAYRHFCHEQEWEHVEEVVCERCLRVDSLNAKLKLLLAQAHRLRTTLR
jgi:hypothetical protein